MLFDPKWDRNSLDGLIAWLLTQDPCTEYGFLRCGDCLIARYAGAMGIRLNEMSAELFAIYCGVDPGCIAIGDMNIVRDRCIPALKMDTYGAALERAKASVAAR
jgi:hypothetical protein